VCLVLRVRACPVRSELYITHPNAKDLFRQLYTRIFVLGGESIGP
jgi:hypothetical protein